MERVARIRERLQAEGADVFLISNPVNRRYITGFTGSAGLVWISSTKQAILTDFRYVEQVKAECPGWELIRIETYNDALEELIKGENIRSIVFEEEHVTVKQLREWQDRFAVELKGSSGWVEELRMCKTPAEIEHIRRAAQIGDEAFAELLPNIKSGRTEREIALELEYLMRRKGASAMSFAPIVASGPQSALPHARPGERILSYGDFVVMDFGCVVNGYCSDMTRTIVIGEPEERHLLIYDLVLKAQVEAVEAVAPGKTGAEIDAIAREIIAEAGYGDYFGHGLGHSVGLEVHENPRLSKTDQTVLAPGMIVTVEPGVYLPGFGGVRIEDLVVVTEDGHEVLTSSFKELYVVE
ncbi:MAG: aminopeptidase P family protein [Limnochordia bacterium]|jgi:Xaa-Pro aminopeptidase|nr:aminopeptidase P family protein [Limnochordia bacterium]MDI9465311.1 aminopeptidase P family protein [Bacillota bacterium]NLO95628.1 aminopeptidase P family protein [Bacillota bacterium]HAN95631.1 Xaa-Pro dipeptidase [Bacillota bacterium]HOB40005.1 aminopeptidase P family protein [Limnochordia bacterium]